MYSSSKSTWRALCGVYAHSTSRARLTTCTVRTHLKKLKIIPRRCQITCDSTSNSLTKLIMDIEEAIQAAIVVCDRVLPSLKPNYSEIARNQSTDTRAISRAPGPADKLE